MIAAGCASTAVYPGQRVASGARAPDAPAGRRRGAVELHPQRHERTPWPLTPERAVGTALAVKTRDW